MGSRATRPLLRVKWPCPADCLLLPVLIYAVAWLMGELAGSDLSFAYDPRGFGTALRHWASGTSMTGCRDSSRPPSPWLVDIRKRRVAIDPLCLPRAVLFYPSRTRVSGHRWTDS